MPLFNWLGSIRSALRRSRRRRSTPLQVIESLEDRCLLSITYNPSTSGVNIVGTAAADVVTVSSIPSDMIRVEVNNSAGGETQDFVAADVLLVVFSGDAGNDSFANATGIPSMRSKYPVLDLYCFSVAKLASVKTSNRICLSPLRVCNAPRLAVANASALSACRISSSVACCIASPRYDAAVAKSGRAVDARYKSVPTFS